ncbi:MAG TPA: GNAT family N-acetyltransferase [Thermoplasmata archaeon]|nr:GNAT family N-acetyltransferase [Thermoplasmata archaeon]
MTEPSKSIPPQVPAGEAADGGVSPRGMETLRRRALIAGPVIVVLYALGMVLLLAGIYRWDAFATAPPVDRILPGEVVLAVCFIPLVWLMAAWWRSREIPHAEARKSVRPPSPPSTAAETERSVAVGWLDEIPMDLSRYTLREYAPSDLAALARIASRVDPTNPTSPEEVLSYDSAFADPRLLRLRRVVEERESKTVVAFSALEQHPWTYQPRKFWADVEVDPDHQHRGLGRTLASHLESDARDESALCLWTTVVSDDDRSVRFFEASGFRVVRRSWISRLDLATAKVDAFPDRSAALAAQGIRFTTLAEEGPDRPEVRRRYYEVHREASRDVPSIVSPSDLSYDQFERFEFGRPGFLPEGTFFAVAGDTYVGLTILEERAREPGVLNVGFTGTRAEYRGRGIAQELKRRSVEWARARGYRGMRTGNDSMNAPMWSINERLGFRRQQTWLTGEKALESEALEAPRSPPT